jgi:hypothetical protein
MFETVQVALALRAGVASGALMFALWMLARLLDMPAPHFIQALGVALTRTNDHTTDRTGFLLHLAISSCAGLPYAAAFEHWGEAGLVRGLTVAAPHAALGAAAVIICIVRCPLLCRCLRPGASDDDDSHTAGALALFAALHLLYGLAMGALYRV